MCESCVRFMGGGGGYTGATCRLPCRRQMSRLMGHATHRAELPQSLIKCATAAATNGLQFKVYFERESHIYRSSRSQLDIVINRHRHVD